MLSDISAERRKSMVMCIGTQTENKVSKFTRVTVNSLGARRCNFRIKCTEKYTFVHAILVLSKIQSMPEIGAEKMWS